jgi:hypothetical protein
MHGRKRDVSKFRAFKFGCRAYIYLNEERRGKGGHIPRAVEAINLNLGFAPDHNMSAYKFYVPSTRKIMLCNQARFDELFFPYRTREISYEIRTTTVPISWAEFLRSGSLTTSRCHRICTKRSNTIARVIIAEYVGQNHSNAILSGYFGFSDGICCLHSTKPDCTRTTRRH